MNHERASLQRRQRRSFRVRKRLRGTTDQPRLSVYRSHKHIYAQLIDDSQGRTLAAVSTLDTDLRGQLSYGGNIEAAKAVGKALAEKASAAGVKRVCFDRGPFKYHGRVAALADAAREAGLSL